ncbi:MAG: DNA translocase FtsK, partial [Bacteroidia bacterium]|nr:DNA translocase FtsK [Bacteroidia bacterium]
MKLPELKSWRTWDEEQKGHAIKITGVCLGLFALFTLISTVSYIFTWRQDQSLLRDPAMMDMATGVANLGGKLGLKWSDVLICKWFGLGSFAFLILLFAMSLRLVAGKWHYSLLKTAIVTFSGAIISSFILALLGKYIGVPALFGAGIGGECGSFVTDWIDNAVGPVITALLLCSLALLWLFFSSKRFSEWFKSLGSGVEKAEACEEPSDPVEESVRPVKAPVRSAVSSFMPQRPENKEPESPAVSPVAAKPVPEVPAEPEHSPEGSFEIDRGENLETVIKKELPRIDVRLDPPEGLPGYKFPSLDILEDHSSDAQVVSDEELNRNNNKIRSTLKNYKIDIVDVKAVVGPTVTLYKVYPAPGVKIANIRSLQDDIAMSLNARGVRIVTLPDSVGIEVANDRPSTVPIKALLNDDAFRNSKAELPVAIGCTITKKVKVFDLADAPHLLVAGATKQGKSVGLNVLVASLLYAKHPSEMKMVFIDPKMVEFSAYGRLLKHYLAILPTAADEDEERDMAIVKKPKDAEKVLRSLCVEMDDRYELMSKAFVPNIKLYNERYKDRKLNPEHGHRFMPYLVVIIDEYADLAMSGGSGSEAKNMQKS